MVKVSVLMPVYKTPEKYLRAAIESILQQTFTDFEFLILDDYPLDNRQKIVASYADKRIKYFENSQNMGISASRNKLIDMAKGEYLAVFDHDDISLPQRLEKEVAYLDEHPECGVISSQSKNMIGGAVTNRPLQNEEIKKQFFVVNCIEHSAAMIRKSVLTDNNIHYEADFTPAEDYALWCRLWNKTEFHNLPEVLFHYRNHSENTTHLQKDKMEMSMKKVKAVLKIENAEYWAMLSPAVSYVSRVKFLGLPILKIVRKGEVTKGYLFHILPVFTSKTKEKFNKI